MKQLTILSILFSILFLPYCTTTKKAAGDSKKMAPTVSYAKDVAPIIQARCTPCHFPDGGKRKFLDTHAALSSQIDDVIHRIELTPESQGFMPFKSKKEPLSDSLIQVIKVWKETGMAE